MVAGKRWRSAGPAIRLLLESLTFRVLSLAALSFALFGGGLSIVLDLPDDPSTLIMDVLMCTVTGFFVLELVLRCVGEPATYPLSGFFFMDAVGTASMVFEISFLLGHAGRMDIAETGVNAVFMRSARAARMGARMGRLSKLLRCMTVLSGRFEPQGTGHHARVLSRKLMTVLSTKVSLLTVVLVLGVPLFSIGQYPEADLSMRAWGRRLEADYALAVANFVQHNLTVNPFLPSVQEMLLFYEDVDYGPYLLEGYPQEVSVHGVAVVVQGVSLVHGGEPNRRESVVKQPVPACKVARAGCEGAARAAIYFDLTGAKRYNAAMDLLIIMFVILSMALEAFDLSQTLNAMVVRPVEKMLDTIHVVKDALHQVITLDDDCDDEDEGLRTKMNSETVVVERVLKKLARLIEVFMDEDILRHDEMVDIDNESRGIIVEIMQHGHHEASRPRLSTRSLAPPSELAVKQLPVDPAVICSWELDVLGMQASDQDKVVCYVLFDSGIGQATGRAWTELETLKRFVESARAEYLDNPYHCYSHACDVVTVCCRLLQQLQWDQFLGEVDAYAILISALCHDVGHPGRTNPFLVEAGDAIALRYNDRSPLENMHCAKLFELCRDPAQDILRNLSREAYKQARAVCILCILHTDNAQHFDMVKEVKKVFEVNIDTCNEQALDPETLADPYLSEVLCKNTLLWHKLFLHLADTANPLKPFWIYMLWATRVADEFFAQGDEEKRLGLPVGMLNDRDKVSRPGSEHGFITFLVSPLVTSTLSVFPTLGPLACQMVSNLESWRNLWVQQANPSPEDIQKRDADVQRIREQVGALCARQPGPTKNL